MTNKEKFLAVFGIQLEDFLAMPKDKAMAWGDKETTPTTSPWITDRRPSYCEDVLVTFTTGEVGGGCYLDFDEAPWRIGEWYFGDEDITAWMPMPEPWKEDGDEG